MTSSEKELGVSLMTVRRLPSYLHFLKQLQARGRDIVSTTHMAEALQLQPDQIRKDLTATGIVGKPKVGYNVPALITAIEKFLCWDDSTNAFLVGVGNLGSALLGYKGFDNHGLNITAAFDVDEEKIGQTINGRKVMELSKLKSLARRMHIHMGIVTVPIEDAQAVADLMVASGIKAIWNFTQVTLQVPDGVVVQNEDLSSGLAILSVRLSAALKGAEGIAGDEQSVVSEPAVEARRPGRTRKQAVEQ